MFIVDDNREGGFDFPAVMIAVTSPRSMMLASFIPTAVIMPTSSSPTKSCSAINESNRSNASSLKSVATVRFNIAFDSR